jgi:hypothetical protein
MGCLTRASWACRAVWSAAAMLPRQPRSRSGAWHTVTHPGHEGAKCARADHRVGQACVRSLCVNGYVARDSCLYTNGHGQHLTAVARMLARRLEACTTGSRHGECVQPGLTQRDMCVMHSPVEAGWGGGVSPHPSENSKSITLALTLSDTHCAQTMVYPGSASLRLAHHPARSAVLSPAECSPWEREPPVRSPPGLRR